MTSWSPNSRLIAIVDQLSGQVGVWDAGSSELVHTTDECPRAVSSVLFTFDSSELVVSCWADGLLVVTSTESWEPSKVVELDPSLPGRGAMHFVGYAPDTTTIVAVGDAMAHGGGSLHWLDAATLEPIHTIDQTNVGSMKSFAISPDRSLFATGSSDGFVQVWDTRERRLYQKIYVGPTQVQGLAFVDDLHLAVSPQTGGMFVYTLDPNELFAIVRGSLTRGFTAAECDRYGFGQDCPSLARLRGDDTAP